MNYNIEDLNSEEKRRCQWCDNSGWLIAQNIHRQSLPTGFRCPYCNYATKNKIITEVRVWSSNELNNYKPYKSSECLLDKNRN